MSTPTDLQAVIDTAVRTVTPAVLAPGAVYAFNTPGGVHKVDLTGPEYRDLPARKTGTTVVRDAFSFDAYWAKHSTDNSEIYADADRLSVTAVLDASSETAANWGSHRLHLQLRETDAWKAWAANDGKLLDQETFANFIEDRLPDIQSPAAADMLEIAQSISGTVKADFASGTRLATGARQLQYTETVTAKAGQKGTLTIPETFVVGLVPFDGSEGYKVTARLRYKIDGSSLRIGYKLQQPADVRRTAFADVLTKISEQIDTPILNGTPA